MKKNNIVTHILDKAKKKKNVMINVFLLVLVVVALALAYAIYRKQYSSPPKSEGELFAEQDTKPTIQPLRSFPDIAALGIELSKEELRALNIPRQDALEEEKQAHFETVIGIAQKGPYLDITKCAVAQPVVFQLTKGEQLRVKNLDTVEHAVNFDKDNIFHIAAGATEEIFPEFRIGPGIYSFSCDTVPHASGIVLVPPGY